MLTIAEYEQLKTKLTGAERDLTAMEARKVQQAEHVRLSYGMSIDEARLEVAKLKEDLPKREEAFNKQLEEFKLKWAAQLQ